MILQSLLAKTGSQLEPPSIFFGYDCVWQTLPFRSQNISDHGRIPAYFPKAKNVSVTLENGK
jgi:hypothetical protein